MTNTKRNTKRNPAKSVMDCVKEFASANPTFRIEDVCKAYPKTPKNQIATALWKMRIAGIVGRDAGGLITVLTDVNKPVGVPKVAKKAKAKPAIKAESKDTSNLKWQVDELEKRARRADMTYEDLATRHRALQVTHDNLRQMHEDALAVIRYLENKLYVVIQQVNNRGGNS